MKRNIKNVVVHLTPTENTMIASANIARRILSEMPHSILVDTKDLAVEAARWTKKREFNLIVVNGPPAFCSFREELAKLLWKSKTWIWAQNDYTIYPPSQMNAVARTRKMVTENGFIQAQAYWTTIPSRVTRKQDQYVNWNALSIGLAMQAIDETNLARKQRKGFIYYGAYRNGRDERFKNYIPPFAYVSAPPRAQAKFAQAIPTATCVPPLQNLVPTLTQFLATVLIQDQSSDKKFMSLPNRFYECLCAGLAQFVSVEMVPSMKKAGYEVPDRWIVHSHHDIDMSKAKKIAADQQSLWAPIAAMDYEEFNEQLSEARRKIRWIP